MKPFLPVCFMVMVASSAAFAEEGWRNLFNGKDLDGWEQRGGQAKYVVENGVIVGSSVLNTPNSFLCPKEQFGNFILELEMKVDPALNSGVQFRSECFDKETTPVGVDGQPIQGDKGGVLKVPAKRLHGYQCEIDVDNVKNRWWTAGIYDEARRGWLFPGKLGGDKAAFTAQGAKLIKQNDWNTLRIEANGASIKTFLNGEPRATITDALTLKGYIGLQVHSVGKDNKKEGLKACFRNIRIKPLEAAPAPEAAANTLTEQEKADGWQLLWDGKTTNGWRSAKNDQFPSIGWVIKDGTITVIGADGAESARGGDIITREQYSDFELQVDFKLTPGANSGIKMFVQTNLGPITKTGQKAAVGSAIGLEYQILDDARHPDAKLGHNGDRTIGSLYDLIPAAASKKPSPIGEWNHGRILSNGNHVEFWLNGDKVVEFERGSEAFRKAVAVSKYSKIAGFGEWPKGHILLQDHGNTVSFRNVKIRVLK